MAIPPYGKTILNAISSIVTLGHLVTIVGGGADGLCQSNLNDHPPGHP